MSLCCWGFAWLNDCANGDEADLMFVQTQKKTPLIKVSNMVFESTEVLWLFMTRIKCSQYWFVIYTEFKGSNHMLIWNYHFTNNLVAGIALKMLTSRLWFQCNYPIKMLKTACEIACTRRALHTQPQTLQKLCQGQSQLFSLFNL